MTEPFVEGIYNRDDPRQAAFFNVLCDSIPDVDAYCDIVRSDPHDGTCWDLVRDLAVLLSRTKLPTPTIEEAPHA